ncbi:hypothetical protein M2125_001002 [Polynucleobacter sphagniphilus]|uniref:type IV secretion system DNA-binding domain-containing protein n=1 Tax=Polynucleobacter sphagniphilus TaxID=1743169 RepID=UPI002476A681|nr:type IV secretion system DNA-binding domain-containing protein [Polynucleobacter sphagniphilus]MDH6241195.1 hypothetical protein [Polynucleobacter sphagniphilus]
MKPINTAKDFSQISQSTAGQQRLGTLLQLEIRKYFFYVLAVLAPTVISIIFLFYAISGLNIFGEIELYLKAQFSFGAGSKVWKITHDGITVWWPSFATGHASEQAKYTSDQVVSMLWSDSFAPYLFWLVVSISIIPGYFSYRWLRNYFEKKGDTTNEILRGGQLLSVKEYLRQVLGSTGFSKFKFGGLRYPKNNEFLGTLIVGAAGSGKSNEYKLSMENAFKLGAKCIVFDPTGEDTQRYFRPGKDILLAPANRLLCTETGEVIEPVGWSILTEIMTQTDTQLIGNAFLPVDPKDKSNFFLMGAQQVFGEILGALRRRGDTSTQEIFDIFSNADRREELVELLKNSSANRILGKADSGQSDGIFGSIANYLNGLKLISDGDFSIRKFVRDQETDARLFICAKDAREILMPLYRVAITLAINELSLMPPANGAVRCCFFIDELPALGYIEKLSPALQEMRKYGVSIMAVCQSLSQIRAIYGEDGGRNLYGAFQNLAVYRTPVKSEQEELIGILGEQEVLERVDNFSLAVQNDRDGVSQNASVTNKSIVHFSELHLLEIGQAYVRFAGFNPLLIDHRLNGKSLEFASGILKGDAFRPGVQYIVFDSVGVKRAGGISDDKGLFEVQITGDISNKSAQDFVVIVPPVFETHNSGIELQMNPLLQMTISSNLSEDRHRSIDIEESHEIEQVQTEEKTQSDEHSNDIFLGGSWS